MSDVLGPIARVTERLVKQHGSRDKTEKCIQVPAHRRLTARRERGRCLSNWKDIEIAVKTSAYSLVPFCKHVGDVIPLLKLSHEAVFS
jgi:hypothetical protein